MSKLVILAKLLFLRIHSNILDKSSRLLLAHQIVKHLRPQGIVKALDVL